MTQQYGSQQQPSKFRQFILPIIILVLAIGAAIYGVMWSSNETNTAPTEDSATAEDTETPEQSDAAQHLADVEDEFPDAEAPQQQALAAARTEMEIYVLSEHQLALVLSDPEFGYELDQNAIDFALDNVEVDWNDQAHQYAVATLQEFPEVELTELEEVMQHDPEGPRFSAEQTEYALAQLD